MVLIIGKCNGDDLRRINATGKSRMARMHDLPAVLLRRHRLRIARSPPPVSHVARETGGAILDIGHDWTLIKDQLPLLGGD
jgi:hypothetical protein